MPDPPPPAWETAELKAVIDAEVAGLPEKFRAAVVLCLLEGHTSAAAADPVKPVAKSREPKPAPEAGAALPAVAPGAEANANAAAPPAATTVLLKPIGKGLDPAGATLEDILTKIEEQTDLIVRVDVAAFRRLGALGSDAEGEVAPSVTLSDARLYDALRVIADMAELKMVYAGNVYYVTTAANAKSFQPAAPPAPPAPIAPAPAPAGGK